MPHYEAQRNRSCRNFFFFLLLLALTLALCGCNLVRINTNLPVQTTRVIFVNNTNSSLSFLIDGAEKAMVFPATTRTLKYWVGGGAYSWSIRVGVTVLNRDKNQSWSDVVDFSSYYHYAYVFTAREDESGRLYVERR